jgi:hypothetical protein
MLPGGKGKNETSDLLESWGRPRDRFMAGDILGAGDLPSIPAFKSGALNPEIAVP